MRILVIDSDRDTLRTCKEWMLAHEAGSLMVVGNTLDAEEALEASNWDKLFIGYAGIDTLYIPHRMGEVLKKLPKEKRTFPIIILTNFDDQVNKDRGAGFGVDGYFVKKDMTVKSLVQMVEKLLAK